MINQHDGLSPRLGKDREWTDLALDLKKNLVNIDLGYAKNSVNGPVCGESFSVHDMPGERVWRHPDTMRFETRIHARTPYSYGLEQGVKVIGLP